MTKRIHQKFKIWKNQRFFPIETILGVGEVKSNINSIGDFNNHLIKLSKLKTLRNHVNDPTPYKRGKFCSEFNPDTNFSDNILTFLLCYKFGFSLDLSKIDYDGADYKLWHNMVFSLKDGLLSYQNNQTKNLFFSFGQGNHHKHCFLENDDSELPQSVNLFLSGLSYFVNNGSLLEIHMERYLTDKLTVVK